MDSEDDNEDPDSRMQTFQKIVDLNVNPRMALAAIYAHVFECLQWTEINHLYGSPEERAEVSLDIQMIRAWIEFGKWVDARE